MPTCAMSLFSQRCSCRVRLDAACCWLFSWIVVCWGYTVFRNIFLFPYALSFIVTGIAWRWIFNPETGINLLFDGLGINKWLASIGAAPLKPGWTTDPSVLLSINDALGHVFPAARTLTVHLGIPIALIPVVVAAGWQLTGFAMSMYIAGLATVPNELREAARSTELTNSRSILKWFCRCCDRSQSVPLSFSGMCP